MRIEKRNLQRMILTEEETEAFKIVGDILNQLSKDIYSTAYIESQITGECIEISEIPRIRGVLGFFEDYPVQIFEVINRKGE